MNGTPHGTITATHLTNREERLDWLLRHFGPLCALQFPKAVYEMADPLWPEHRDSFWKHYELSNGGFYMAPDLQEERVKVSVKTNDYDGLMSCDAAGVTICLFVLRRLALASARPCWTKHYHSLREFAGLHPESGEILAAIG